MKNFLPALFLSLGLSTTVTAPATAYPVECAILLCLAGSWPASVECAHARAVFIARITPWPIEPLLQIWNCPMRASFLLEDRRLGRILDIALRADLTSPALSVPQVSVAPMLIDAQADVDISYPAFDFVRSIRASRLQFEP